MTWNGGHRRAQCHGAERKAAKDRTKSTRKGLEVWSLGIKKKKGSISLTEEGAMEILTTNLNDHSQ